MISPFSKIEIAVKKAQKTTPENKKKILVFISVTTTFLVVFLWIVYFKTTLPTLENKKIGETAVSNETSAWQTFINGFKIISGDIKQKFGLFRSQLTESFDELKEQAIRTNEITVQNASTSEDEVRNSIEK